MDKKKIQVLLLSAPIGSGHQMAAEAIKEEFQGNPSVEVIHGNVFSFFPKFLGDIFLTVYLWVLKICPWVYQMTYAWGNKKSGSLWLRNLINRILLCLGSNFLNRVNPDIVIATHATPAGIMSFYKEKHPEIFLGVVVTDFTVHKWWICKNVDAYFVADEKLVSKFPKSFIVKPFGIPLRKAFTVDDEKDLRTDFGWEKEEIVCLVMGGGEGLLPMEEILSSLNNIKCEKLRLVCICGNNKNLKNKLEQKYSQVSNIEILGFTDKLPDRMKAADIIITKSGGLTSSEVLACNLKFVIYKPLPGQEMNNAVFLKENHGALIAENSNDLLLKINDILVNSSTSQCYEFNGKYATKNICDYIQSEFSRKS